jgi:hypothetical protein
VWPAILFACALSLANLTLLALAAAGLIRFLPPLTSRAVAQAPFWGGAFVLGTALLALMLSTLAQIALWAGAFVLCGEFADFEKAFNHSAVNFTTLDPLGGSRPTEHGKTDGDNDCPFPQWWSRHGSPPCARFGTGSQ